MNKQARKPAAETTPNEAVRLGLECGVIDSQKAFDRLEDAIYRSAHMMVGSEMIAKGASDCGDDPLVWDFQIWYAGEMADQARTLREEFEAYNESVRVERENGIRRAS